MLLCAIPASSIWASLTCRCRRQSSSVPCSALQCPAVRPTDRIPSHNGKRELAPQLHGNTPVQEKRIKALYGKELWHSFIISYGAATFAFFQIWLDFLLISFDTEAALHLQEWDAAVDALVRCAWADPLSSLPGAPRKRWIRYCGNWLPSRHVVFPLTDLHRNSFSLLPGHSIELGKLRSCAIGSNQQNST